MQGKGNIFTDWRLSDQKIPKTFDIKALLALQTVSSCAKNSKFPYLSEMDEQPYNAFIELALPTGLPELKSILFPNPNTQLLYSPWANTCVESKEKRNAIK